MVAHRRSSVLVNEMNVKKHIGFIAHFKGKMHRDFVQFSYNMKETDYSTRLRMNGRSLSISLF